MGRSIEADFKGRVEGTENRVTERGSRALALGAGNMDDIEGIEVCGAVPDPPEVVDVAGHVDFLQVDVCLAGTHDSSCIGSQLGEFAYCSLRVCICTQRHRSTADTSAHLPRMFVQQHPSQNAT